MNARFQRFRFETTLAITSAVLLLTARAAVALDLTVNSAADEPAADAANAACVSSVSGLCTLRAAIMVTNFFGGPNTITVPAGTYTLTRPGYDDAALVGDLDITNDLTIQGAGSAATIIDGNGSVTNDRVFQILSTVQTSMLRGLTIRNGKSIAGAGGVVGGGGLYIETAGFVGLNDVIFEGNTGMLGGGIYANFPTAGGFIEMDRVILRSNTATSGGSGAGGGAYIKMSSSQSNAIVQDSQIYSNTTDGYGGGLMVEGNTIAQLLIYRTEIYSNTAVSGGGAIYSSLPLSLFDSRLHDNHVTFDGGAIEAYAKFTISRTTLNANSAGRYGGAIYDSPDDAYGSNPEFGHVEQSTLNGNFAQDGGAIYHRGLLDLTHPLVLLNSTVSGNGAAGGTGGGGIYVFGGQTLLLNATIAGNHVNLGGGWGGGLYLDASTYGVDFKARDSLIANNWHNGTVLQGRIADDGYTHGTVTGELAFDLIQTTTNFFISGPQGGNVLGQDPLLGPLQGNGGFTQTHALLPGSPAINAGATAGCTMDVAGVTPLTMDQRGALRPYPAGGRCDIGAFESRPVSLDIDASSPATKYDPLTDGVLIIRYMRLLTDSSLTNAALGATATRTDPNAIKDYLDGMSALLDVDGDGAFFEYTDGLLILRYLFGLTGDSLVAGAVAVDATRKTAAEIQAYIQSLMP